MSFNSKLQRLGTASGTLNTVVAGVTTPYSVQTGASFIPVLQAQKGSISCEFDLTAATATITLFAEWQVSDDNVTWLAAPMQNNAASVAVATGTQAIRKVVLAAPMSVYAFRYCRPVVRNQVATGAATDLYVMIPRYMRTSAMPRRPIKPAVASGNLNTIVAGVQTAAPKVLMQNVSPLTLSAQLDLTAATATIQLFGEWQVSDDDITWLDAPVTNAAAAVVVTTGTAGIVKVVLEAPISAYSAKYARAVVRNQVATGAAGDLYAVTYRYARPEFQKL